MYGQIKIPPEKNAPQSLHGEDQGVQSWLLNLPTKRQKHFKSSSPNLLYHLPKGKPALTKTDAFSENFQKTLLHQFHAEKAPFKGPIMSNKG